MPIFPDNIKFNYPLSVKSEWKTLISQFETGKEQRRQRWMFPLRTIVLKKHYSSGKDIDMLWNFYNICKGSFIPFDFWYPVAEKRWSGEFIGYGDNSNTSFALPVKDSPSDLSSSSSIYIDGVEQSKSTKVYSLTNRTSPEDSIPFNIKFANPPPIGAIITADFTGCLLFHCRFAQEGFTQELLQRALYSTGITLQEVRQSSLPYPSFKTEAAESKVAQMIINELNEEKQRLIKRIKQLEGTKAVVVITGEVDTYNDLPSAAEHEGEFWRTLNPTKNLLFSDSPADIYFSDGSKWKHSKNHEINKQQYD